MRIKQLFNEFKDDIYRHIEKKQTVDQVISDLNTVPITTYNYLNSIGTLINKRGAQGQTLFMKLCKREDFIGPFAMYCINNFSANVNSEDDYGYTPMHILCGHSN